MTRFIVLFFRIIPVDDVAKYWFFFTILHNVFLSLYFFFFYKILCIGNNFFFLLLFSFFFWGMKKRSTPRTRERFSFTTPCLHCGSWLECSLNLIFFLGLLISRSLARVAWRQVPLHLPFISSQRMSPSKLWPTPNYFHITSITNCVYIQELCVKKHLYPIFLFFFLVFIIIIMCH